MTKRNIEKHILMNKSEAQELQKKAKLTLVSSTSIVEGGAHDVIQKESTSIK